MAIFRSDNDWSHDTPREYLLLVLEHNSAEKERPSKRATCHS